MVLSEKTLYSLGRRCVYIFNRRKAKKEIPAKSEWRFQGEGLAGSRRRSLRRLHSARAFRAAARSWRAQWKCRLSRARPGTRNSQPGTTGSNKPAKPNPTSTSPPTMRTGARIMVIGERAAQAAPAGTGSGHSILRKDAATARSWGSPESSRGRCHSCPGLSAPEHLQFVATAASASALRSGAVPVGPLELSV